MKKAILLILLLGFPFVGAYASETAIDGNYALCKEKYPFFSNAMCESLCSSVSNMDKDVCQLKQKVSIINDTQMPFVVTKIKGRGVPFTTTQPIAAGQKRDFDFTLDPALNYTSPYNSYTYLVSTADGRVNDIGTVGLSLIYSPHPSYDKAPFYKTPYGSASRLFNFQDTEGPAAQPDPGYVAGAYNLAFRSTNSEDMKSYSRYMPFRMIFWVGKALELDAINLTGKAKDAYPIYKVTVNSAKWAVGTPAESYYHNDDEKYFQFDRKKHFFNLLFYYEVYGSNDKTNWKPVGRLTPPVGRRFSTDVTPAHPKEIKLHTQIGSEIKVDKLYNFSLGGTAFYYQPHNEKDNYQYLEVKQCIANKTAGKDRVIAEAKDCSVATTVDLDTLSGPQVLAKTHDVKLDNVTLTLQTNAQRGDDYFVPNGMSQRKFTVKLEYDGKTISPGDNDYGWLYRYVFFEDHAKADSLISNLYAKGNQYNVITPFAGPYVIEKPVTALKAKQTETEPDVFYASTTERKDLELSAQMRFGDKKLCYGGCSSVNIPVDSRPSEVVNRGTYNITKTGVSFEYNLFKPSEQWNGITYLVGANKGTNLPEPYIGLMNEYQIIAYHNYKVFPIVSNAPELTSIEAVHGIFPASGTNRLDFSSDIDNIAKQNLLATVVSEYGDSVVMHHHPLVN